MENLVVWHCKVSTPGSDTTAGLGLSSQSTKEQENLPAATSTSSGASLQSLTSLLTQCLDEFPDF